MDSNNSPADAVHRVASAREGSVEDASRPYLAELSRQLWDWLCEVNDILQVGNPRARRGGKPVPPTRELSKREEEVVVAFDSAMTYREVADHLGISINTLRCHVRHLYEKLGVDNRSGAVFVYNQRKAMETK